MKIPCFSCERPYERQRISGHYCPECQLVRRRKRSAEIKAEKRRAAREAAAHVEQFADEDDVGGGYSTLLVRVESGAEYEYREQLGMAKDIMPPGSSSPYGAEDGRSTYNADLADALDSLSARAEYHRWWLDNPHWNINLYD